MRDEIERSAADSFGSIHFISRFFTEKKRNPCRGRIKDRLVSLDSFSRESLESNRGDSVHSMRIVEARRPKRNL